MLNREKYAKEIAEIACNGKHIAIAAGKPMLCCEASCDTCDIEYDCTRGLKEWANSEYVEPPVDWSKIPVDTPILVRNEGVGKEWEKRYFARYIDGKIYAWPIGTTSWSHGNKAVSTWDYAKARKVMIECIRTAARDSKTERIKVSCLDIIVTTTGKAPYYEIKYKEIGEDYYHVGYSSYKLENVLAWKDECFEIVKECRPQTNADRIRNMTDEELLDFLCSIETYEQGSVKTIEGGVAMCSVTEVEQWLKAESEG